MPWWAILLIVVGAITALLIVFGLIFLAGASSAYGDPEDKD